LEYCEKIEPGFVPRAVLSTHVYVCLNCGRRSYDRLGHQALIPGWSQSCTKAAVRLPSNALKLDHRGVVCAVRKRDVIALRKISLS